ncbi:MAG: META domain-containing protein [Sphingomonadaceae bacterium]|nr:META domain-containing protein [Sphingomonadaceae bacterium]
MALSLAALPSPLTAQPSGLDSTLDPGLDAAPPPALADGHPPLAGTRWSLVQYFNADGTGLVPATPGPYTLAFAADGTVVLQLDCNSASGSWTAGPATGALRLGALTATQAACVDMTLHDRILADAGDVRGYLVDDGHLWLALTPGNGAYDFVAVP